MQFEYLTTNLCYGILMDIYIYPSIYYFLNPNFLKIFFFKEHPLKRICCSRVDQQILYSGQSELCVLSQVTCLHLTYVCSYLIRTFRIPFPSKLQTRYPNLPFCWKQLRMLNNFFHPLKCTDKMSIRQIKNEVKSNPRSVPV